MLVRKKKKPTLVFLLFGSILLIGIGTAAFFYITSPGHQATQTVEEFYTLEQKGAFASSWEFFHPYMKERFPKGYYIQDRAHVFMNHFGVDTFSYTMGDVEKVTKWKVEKEAEPISVVYRVEVQQTYKGKYGNFTLVQEVFATEVEGEWRLLWDYKK